MQEFTLDKLPKHVLAKIDLQTAFMASRCVVAAEKLQVFRVLHGKEMTPAAIGKNTGIRGWRLEMFLNALVALGLLQRKGTRYRNSRLAEKYFIRERSVHWTRLYSDVCTGEYQLFSVLEESLTTGKDPRSILGLKGKQYLELLQSDPQWANDFTHMLYQDHLPDARALAQNLDLRKHNRVLDVGGGSGVMSIALVQKYKHLHACVLDFEPVIRVTKKIIRREKLTGRISTHAGDMADGLPPGFDVIMFCDADIPSPKFFNHVIDSLPAGGLVVLVENYSSEDLTEPFYRLMWQLRSKARWLITRQQAVNMVRDAGFVGVKRKRIYKDVWMITGRKPKRPRAQ